MPKFSLTCTNWRAMRSNSLLGFLDLEVPEMRLRIREATVHESHGKRWVGLPAKPQVTREGTVRRDERGKTAYSPVIEFTDRATRDAFSERAIAALLEKFPRALDDGGHAS